MTLETSTVLDTFVDGAILSWSTRKAGARAPNVRLAELIRRDERAEAYLDAVRIWDKPLWQRLLEELATGEHAAMFPLVCLAVERQGDDRLASVIAALPGKPPASAPGEASTPAEEALSPQKVRVSAFTAALCWAARADALPVVERLAGEQFPLLRAIAIAALGNRRADPGEQVLARLAHDPDPLPRARAFRATGQLGQRDLMLALAAASRADPDPECRFWAAWSAARMGAEEPLRVLAEIAREDGPRADAALEMLLRRLPIEPANAVLRDFARHLPQRRRSLIRAAGIVGDPLYIPWLIERMAEPEAARLAGEALSMITGLDLAYRDLDRDAPEGFESGPNDDPSDKNVALDEDGWLPWPDPDRISAWWTQTRGQFPAGTPFFLGAPKASADWLGALTDGFQRQRLAAALELALRQPSAPMFEARARGRLQRSQLVRAAATR